MAKSLFLILLLAVVGCIPSAHPTPEERLELRERVMRKMLVVWLSGDPKLTWDDYQKYLDEEAKKEKERKNG